MSMTAVRLEAVSKRYGTHPPVLTGIDLHIAAGELFFLLGPSGCGKSTLLRIVAGFLQPEHGRVWFGDREITHLPPEQRATGMVFQNYALWPHMTVTQNVAFGLEIRKIARPERERRVAEALQRVGLGDLGDRPVPALSGGQQQRVALARALVIEPKVLLLDEPLSNLDAKLRLEMRGEIRRICKQAGLTTVYVTHDQKEALSMADRMAVLHEGRLIQVGSPTEVYRRPVSRFVADFIGEANFLAGRITRRTGQEAELDTPWGHLHSLACPAGAAVGSDCQISIRPESIRFVDPEAPGPNRVAMTVEAGTYLGELGQWALRAGEERVKVFELQPRARAEGDLVWCQVAPEDVVVLPAESGGARP
jgi:iron(III) transport system ATP-binding protein